MSSKFKYTITPMASESEVMGKAYVHYKSWQEAYRGLVDDEYLDAHTPEKCVKIAKRFPDGILVAKDGERVIGFVGFGKYRDETLPGAGEVYAIYVLAEYHGQRVGYELMKAAVERLGDHERIALWVLHGNNRAIRFYERFGFKFDGASASIMLGTPRTELRMIYECRQ